MRHSSCTEYRPTDLNWGKLVNRVMTVLRKLMRICTSSSMEKTTLLMSADRSLLFWRVFIWMLTLSSWLTRLSQIWLISA